MIRVHHLNSSRSTRVLWLLEELGLEYTIVPYERDPKTMFAPESLRAVHPLGKAPVVEIDGRIYAESGAILTLLTERYGEEKLSPARGSEAYDRYVYFMHYAEGSLMPPLLLALVLRKMGPLGWPARGYVRGQLTRHFDFLEGELGRFPYVAGESFSAADIQMSFPIEAGLARGGAGEGRPNVRAYHARLRERPAYQRALAQGGELTLG